MFRLLLITARGVHATNLPQTMMMLATTNIAVCGILERPSTAQLSTGTIKWPSDVTEGTLLLPLLLLLWLIDLASRPATATAAATIAS